MAVSTRGRRRITVNGRVFVWYVSHESEEMAYVLRVISTDKHFHVFYPLGKPRADQRFAGVVGREFQGMVGLGHTTRRFRSPAWEVGGTVTPAIVRAFILWCLDPAGEPDEVDWVGRPAPSGRGNEQ